jgi:hypothetical protein
MMKETLDGISHVIQLAIAPVFLLTGIGALLNVMMQRLARIVDRAHKIEDMFPIADANRAQEGHEELRTLSHRLRLINRSVTALVMSALLTSAVIVGLFVSEYYAWSPDLTKVVATAFAFALAALTLGLLFFLREVYMATETLRIGIR